MGLLDKNANEKDIWEILLARQEDRLRPESYPVNNIPAI